MQTVQIFKEGKIINNGKKNSRLYNMYIRKILDNNL